MFIAMFITIRAEPAYMSSFYIYFNGIGVSF